MWCIIVDNFRELENQIGSKALQRFASCAWGADESQANWQRAVKLEENIVLKMVCGYPFSSKHELRIKTQLPFQD